MSAKILVADDSMTIQKVVGITLANTGLASVECLNEKDMFAKLKKGDIDLLLLDFNLSDTKSGQSLIQEIAGLYPGLPILVMLGTFDAVDEDAILRAGARDKIVKPFDGQKFVQLCKKLVAPPVEESVAEDAQEEEAEETAEAHGTQEAQVDGQDEDELDGWGVSESPNVLSMSSRASEQDGPQGGQRNVLAQEIEGWGMSVPGVIGGQAQGLLPPKIDGAGPSRSPSIVAEPAPEWPTAPAFAPVPGAGADGPTAYPENDDLDFPDLETFSRQASGQDLQGVKLTSKLVPLSDLSGADDDEEEREETTSPSIALPPDEAMKLEKEINAEISPDDFWAADETVAAPETAGPIVHGGAAAPALSPDEMVERVKAALMPMIEKLVQEHCRQTIERVAWEVIPDLAENLIKKELGDISQSIK